MCVSDVDFEKQVETVQVYYWFLSQSMDLRLYSNKNDAGLENFMCCILYRKDHDANYEVN